MNSKKLIFIYTFLYSSMNMASVFGSNQEDKLRFYIQRQLTFHSPASQIRATFILNILNDHIDGRQNGHKTFNKFEYQHGNEKYEFTRDEKSLAWKKIQNSRLNSFLATSSDQSKTL